MKKVIVLGGGVAGMSAAHELVERGYTVEVYEKNVNYAGGKARSVDYFGSGPIPFKDPLPGEHGFRFFPGFYKHITDTMKRIPFANGSVHDNLTPTSRIMVARYNHIPIITNASFPKSLKDIELIVHDLYGIDSGLTKEQILLFAKKIWQLMTSSDIRINDDYERIGWWEYLEADRFPGKNGELSSYQSLLVQGLTRTLVAAKAETASTKTGGRIFIQLLYSMFDPNVMTDRVLNGPTNEKWLNPWKEYLIQKGVVYKNGCELTKFNLDDKGMIDSVVVKSSQQEQQTIKGDYYVLAVPVERAANLISDEMIKTDPCLKVAKELSVSVSWMNGIQFYLNTSLPINKGHVIYSDSEWAITSISQIQFWKDYSLATKGNGDIKEILSVDISDWFKEGKYIKKCASDCTKEEIAKEVWMQIKDSLNKEGKIILEDSMLVDYFLDRDIQLNALPDSQDDTLLSNREPLLVNTINSWSKRLDAHSDIRNLFFASDYIRTFTDLATMEGANEAARRAVNGILSADNSNKPLCKIWPLNNPLILRPLQWYDRNRWKKGLPWTESVPTWLKIIMVLWVGPIVLLNGLKLIFYKLFNLAK